jgi:malate/lactate dehydrogenase
MRRYFSRIDALVIESSQNFCGNLLTSIRHWGVLYSIYPVHNFYSQDFLHMAEAQTNKKVLVIGASGSVGMATRDAITQYLGADVITWDRPGADLAAREARVKQYQELSAIQDSLDAKQANWLLRDHKKADVSGQVSSVETIKQGIEQGVDCIVITAGKPRKAGQDRSAVAAANAPLFKDLGNNLADIVFEKIKADPAFKMPVIIQAGNPLDTMTEILGRTMHERLTSHANDAIKTKNYALAKPLADAAKFLEQKLVGQSGVLDGARAAFAIHKVLNEFPINKIVSAPVIGTHNENMVIDFDHVKVLDDAGKPIKLTDHPLFKEAVSAKADELRATPELNPKQAVLNEITKETKAGGSAVIGNYKGRAGIDQSAFVATGAAIMDMVDAVLNKSKTIPAAAYLPPSTQGRFRQGAENGVVIGQVVKLGKDGLEERPRHLAMNASGQNVVVVRAHEPSNSSFSQSVAKAKEDITPYRS